MSNRNKNALRQYFIAPFTGNSTVPANTAFLPLAKYITEVTDNTENITDEFVDYAGDGTVQVDVLGLTESWDFSGTFDASDRAQAHIAGLRRATRDGRKVWLRMIDSNETQEVTGIATVLDIRAGSGAAEELEEFSCTIRYDQKPTVRALS